MHDISEDSKFFIFLTFLFCVVLSIFIYKTAPDDDYKFSRFYTTKVICRSNLDNVIYENKNISNKFIYRDGIAQFETMGEKIVTNANCTFTQKK
jgi:hypothetical protein